MNNSQIYPQLGVSAVTIAGPLPVPVTEAALAADATATGSITATAQSVSILSNGAGNLVFNVTGTWSGTLQPQLQLEDGSWVNATVFPVLPGGVGVSTITANGQWEVLPAGFKAFQLLSTGTWTSGTATVSIEASAANSTVAVRQLTAANLNAQVVGPVASGSAVSGNPVQVAGSDGTDVRAIATDTNGQVKVLVEGGSGIPITGTVTAEIEGHAGATLDAAPGSAIPTNAVMVGGTDGTDLRAILMDSLGRQEVVGAVASGAVIGGNPVYIAGFDGTYAQGLYTDARGQLRVLVENSVTVLQGTSPWITEDKADGTPGSAVPTTALQIAGSDGTDLRTLLTNASGQQLVVADSDGTSNAAAAAWTSATSLNTAVTLVSASFKYNTLLVTLNQAPTGTLTGGGVIFEVSNDNSGWQALAGVNTVSNAVSNAYTFGVGLYTSFLFNLSGWQYFRVRLNPAIVGTGTVTVGFAAQSLGLPLVLTQDAADVAQASTTSGQVGPLVQMATVTSAPTDTNAKTNPLRGDANGCLRINPAGQTGSFSSVTGSSSGTSQITITVPAGKKWILKSSRLVLTAGASAGSRVPLLVCSDASANDFAAAAAGLTTPQGISTVVGYCFAPSLPTSTVLSAAQATVGFPEVVLGPGFTVTTVTSGLAAADSQAIVLNIEVFAD